MDTSQKKSTPVPLVLRNLRGFVLRRAAIFLVFAAFAGALGVASHVWLGDDGEVSVVNTEIEIVEPKATGSLFWLDDNRLLIAGINTRELNAAIAKKQSNLSGLINVYLWNETTQTAQRYANAISVCYSDGFVSFVLHANETDGKQIVREGAFGSEIELERARPPVDSIWSEFTCKTHMSTDLLPPAPSGRRLVVLRQGDGYIDLGPRDTDGLIEEIRSHGDGHVRLYRQDKPQGVDLPMGLEQGVGILSYSEFKRAYVSRPRWKGFKVGNATDWPYGTPFSVYSITASGEVTHFEIPYRDVENVSRILPVRTGWIFGGGNFYRSSGLYLFDGHAAKKIATGLVREIAVSPNGCKAAVAIINQHLKKGWNPTSVRTMNFCAEGKGHERNQ